MAKFMRFPWSVSGDRTAVPEATDPSGGVSYTQGFGPDYERDPATDPLAKRVPRAETNQYLFDITDNIRQYQLAGAPTWYDKTNNGGVAISYPINAIVRHNDVVWRSLVSVNTYEPGTDSTKWELQGSIPFASNSEVQAGVSTVKVVSPAGLSARIATETRTGLVELATAAEVQAGTDPVRAITPAGLRASVADNAEVQAGVSTSLLVTPAGLAARIATETRTGIVELATATEVQAGTDPVRAITPAGLAARIATETRTGLVELATEAEVQAGTDPVRAVTPAGLASLTSDTGRRGLIEIAHVTEVQAGTDTERAVTPAGLSGRTATETRTGLVELATATEVRTGTDATRAITPAALRASFAVGGVGTYAFLYHPTLPVTEGDQYPGSALRYAGIAQSGGAANMSISTSAPPGTVWTACGASILSGDVRYATLWYREA
jgi:hypothetical protein